MTTPSDLTSLLSAAYQGEVLGEAFFAMMAEREDDVAIVSQWREVERLERHVKTRLRAELERRGLPSDEDPAKREVARQLAAGLSVLGPIQTRAKIVETLRGEVKEARTSMEALPTELAELGKLFVAHEEALLAHFEKGGNGAPDPDGPVARFLRESGAPEEAPVPEGVQLTPLDPAYQADPAVAHRELQRRAPVHRDRQFGGLVVSGHDIVRKIAYDLDFFVDPRKAREDDPVRQFLTDERDREPSMLFLDDPEHNRLRNLVSRAFTPRAVKALHPLIEQVATELLDSIEAEGAPEFDLIERLAAPLPAIAIARILGVDPAKQAQFKTWSVASSEAFFNPFADEETKRKGDEAQAALDAVFRDEIAARKEKPADDLIGKLVAGEGDDRLTEDELVAMCGLLLVAGNVTTTDLIGNGMRALLEHPEQHEKLRETPELLANAVEEMLRFDPPVQATGRIAPRDCEIEGVPARKGESVTVLLAAANRDPDVYPDPDRFDIGRDDTHHHSFGGGAHLCLGAHLARAEARAAIGALVARFPKLRPAGGAPAWKATPGFRGLAEYRVRVD